MAGKKGAQCRVCQAKYTEYYESLRRVEKLSCAKLSRRAKEKGENISRKSFESHFKRHTDLGITRKRRILRAIGRFFIKLGQRIAY